MRIQHIGNQDNIMLTLIRITDRNIQVFLFLLIFDVFLFLL